MRKVGLLSFSTSQDTKGNRSGNQLFQGFRYKMKV